MVFNPKVKKTSIKILLIGIAVLITINLLSRLNLLDFTSSTNNVITIIGALFLMSDIGLRSLAKGGFPTKLNQGISWIFGIGAFIAGFSAFLAIVGVNFAVISPYQEAVEIILLVGIVVEIFR